MDAREIGRRLNAGSVLEGSVRRAGKRLRISAQLINIADGYPMWSETPLLLRCTSGPSPRFVRGLGLLLNASRVSRDTGPDVLERRFGGRDWHKSESTTPATSLASLIEQARLEIAGGGGRLRTSRPTAPGRPRAGVTRAATRRQAAHRR